jgi:putative hydrolase
VRLGGLKLKIVVDTHTHTVSSGHAYSTVQEIAREAPNNGIEMLAITDHGPSMKGAPCLYHFGNLRVIPKILYGVKILKGVEANIIDYSGNVDMPDDYLKRLDFTMASFHDICIKPASIEEHTNALINILKNPLIDAIAHPGNPQFQIDIDKVVKAAKEYNKLIEINNHSFLVRAGSESNCREIARTCKEYGVRIVCGSDAHISFDVGKFDHVYKLLDDIKMPEKLILNTSVNKFEEYLLERKARLI